MFDRVFTFLMSTCFAFMLISSMEDLGRLVGFEQMGELGVAIIFGSVYLNLMIMNDKKKDKEEEKEDAD